MTEDIVSIKSYLSVPISVLIHVLLIVLTSGHFISQKTDTGKNTKTTVIEFEEPIPQTKIIADKGEKSDFQGINRGIQNQEALDQSQKLLPSGENYNEQGIVEKRLHSKQPDVKTVSSPAQQPNQSPKNVEPVKSNSDETSELRKSTKKVFSTTSSIFRPKNETGVKNLETSSGKYGSFTLSSYEWEYAPYMLDWIEKIKNNWVEPISYLAGKGKGGQVLVKTTLFKSGVKKKIELLFTNVNDEMTKEALKAVEKSFNLPELPASFKENELVVTFSMIYPAY